MAKHFFKKEIVSKPLIGPEGKPINFEPIPGNTGLLVIDSEAKPDLVEWLLKNTGKKGLSEITQDEHLGLKKKREYQAAQRPSRPQQNVLRPFTMHSPFGDKSQQKPEAAASAAKDDGSPSAPAPPPPPNVMPDGWKPEAAKPDPTKSLSDQAAKANETQPAAPDPAPEPPAAKKKAARRKIAKPATKGAKEIAKQLAQQ